MRIRPIAALSVAALTALLLAGCSSAGPDADPTPSVGEPVVADLCASAAPGGEVADSVTVNGEVGETPTVEFEAPLEIESAERAVVVEGDGPAIDNGDYVSYAVGIYDASTGETLRETGFGGAGLPAMALTVGSGADTYFGCATEGSRLVVAVPSPGEGTPAQVLVIDVLEVTAADEWCAIAEPGADFPTVEFSADGVPTVTIPAADPPADVQLQVLAEGDGDVVQSGDNVTVDYTGVKWSDGSVFDSSWERGEPATFSTTGVVTGFQRALEGQAVGSTLVVSIPPACGYGETGTTGHELEGETLVFVVEILETARPE